MTDSNTVIDSHLDVIKFERRLNVAFPCEFDIRMNDNTVESIQLDLQHAFNKNIELLMSVINRLDHNHKFMFFGNMSCFCEQINSVEHVYMNGIVVATKKVKLVISHILFELVCNQQLLDSSTNKTEANLFKQSFFKVLSRFDQESMKPYALHYARALCAGGKCLWHTRDWLICARNTLPNSHLCSFHFDVFDGIRRFVSSMIMPDLATIIIEYL